MPEMDFVDILGMVKAARKLHGAAYAADWFGQIFVTAADPDALLDALELLRVKLARKE